MARIISYALVALSSLLVLQCCVAYDLSDALNLPKPEDFGQDLHKNVRDGLLRLDVNENTTPEQIKEQVNHLARYGGEYKDLFQTLSQLAEKKVSDPAKLVSVLKSMIAQMIAEPTSKFSDIARNLKEKFISEHYERFEAKTSNGFPHNSGPNYIFDEMFAKAMNKDIHALGYKGDNAYKGLTHLLKDVDLAQDNLRVNDMIEHASSHHLIAPGRELLDPLSSWMNINCREFQNPKIKLLLDIFNLESVLIKGYSLPMISRLNHYARLCKEWSEPERHKKIMENLEKRAKVCLCREPSDDQIPI